MGHIPLPMRPIPPDATPEQRQRIMDDYRAYLVDGLAYNNAMIGWSARYLLVLAAVVIFVVIVLAVLR